MPTLAPNPILKDYQNYVVELEKERGFDDQSVIQKCLLLGEETGELFKAVRKQQGMSIDAQSQHFSAEEEMADVLIMLCAIANRLNIDMEQAFRNKEEINKKRKWTAFAAR